MFDYQKVKIVGVTQPRVEGIDTANDFIAYCARVSNPANQMSLHTADKLLAYLARNAHWSPFEMVHVCMEIKTTRDIGRQILRHRSFSFQEFSQRYAEVNQEEYFVREARLQDNKNRQNSIKSDDDSLNKSWEAMQENVMHIARQTYEQAIKYGVAKEQARVVLPEGLTMSTMYMSGTLRSWIHYCDLRCKNGTQKEHMDIANKAWQLISEEFPSLSWMAIMEK